MKGFTLTQNQILELRVAHKAERNRNSAYKINAVILLGSEWTLDEVNSALLLDQETLRSYVSKYETGGLKALIATNYLGKRTYLNEAQQEALVEELDSSIYLTCDAIIDYIFREFEVQYTATGARDLLHRLGYEYKKPKLVPGKPDPEAQEEFAAYYEEFMLNKPTNIEVLFCDAVHPEHNTMAAYGWIKRGEKRKLKTNSGRQRLNLHGAINAETMEMTLIESDAANKDSTIQLLEMIDKKYEHADEVIVILDNASYHRSVEVRELENVSPRLKLVFLPPYSPELNLIERVWKYFKKNVLYNKYYEDLKSFRAAAIDFFSKIENHKNQLLAILGADFENIYT